MVAMDPRRSAYCVPREPYHAVCRLDSSGVVKEDARARVMCVCVVVNGGVRRCMYVCMACAFLNPDARASRDTRAMVFASRDGSCGRHSTMSRRAAFGVGVRDVRAKICTLVHACVNVWVCVGDVLMRAGIRRRAGTSTAIRATRTRAPRRRLRRLSVCVVFV